MKGEKIDQAVDIVNAIEEIPAVQVETVDDIAQKVRDQRRKAVVKMMTTEMICKNLRDMLCDPLCKGEMTGNQIEAVRQSINALSAQQEAERNEPLTLDELREMAQKCEGVYVASLDGTPVFRDQTYCAAVLDFSPAFGSMKMHVKAIYGDRLTFWEDDYGKTWLAYRHKLEK